MVAIFIQKPTPFIEEFFDKIANLEYDKEKIALFIHNNVEYHEEDVDSFLEDHKSKYISVDVLNPKDSVKEWHARNKGIQKCQSLKCDFYFSVDSDAHVDNPESLKLLIGIFIYLNTSPAKYMLSLEFDPIYLTSNYQNINLTEQKKAHF